MGILSIYGQNFPARAGGRFRVFPQPSFISRHSNPDAFWNMLCISFQDVPLYRLYQYRYNGISQMMLTGAVEYGIFHAASAKKDISVSIGVGERPGGIFRQRNFPGICINQQYGSRHVH
jgi:hypothetical protein